MPGATNMPHLRRTYQTPSSLNGSSVNSSGSSSPSAPFTNFRNFSHAGSPAPGPTLFSGPSIHSTTNITAASPASVSSTTTTYPALSAIPGKYNGYADLPNQVFRRSVRKGFALNIIVVGETGTGKSTFVNSLFSADIYDGNETLGISHRIGQTIQVEKTRVSFVEKGVQVRLTIVDVPGFGHYVDNSSAWNSVVAYIEKRYHEYIEREMSVKRNMENYLDDRIHCCLYFIAPNGHGLRPLDIQAMKALGTKVNVIPVIGRADTLTMEECREFKEKIRQELKDNDIKLYDFPLNSDTEDEDDDIKRNGKKENIRTILPFAVIGSNTFIETKDGRKVRGRKYPWGNVEIDNIEHCDFTILRRLLLRVYLSDLMDVTNDVHYENYRCEYFNKVSPMPGVGGLGGNRPTAVDGVPMGTPVQGVAAKQDQRSPLAQLEAEKKEMEGRIAKMKSEMQAIFDQKVKEKEQKLSDTEKDLEKKYQAWDKDWEAHRKKLEQDRLDYESQKRQLGDAYPTLYSMLQEELLRAASASDSASSGGSPGGTVPSGTMQKKAAKSKKSFLEKGFL